MLKMFAVFDLKAASYGMPMFLVNKGVALRGFSDACQKPDSPFALHPGDYRLDELGEYDPNLGLVTCLQAPKALVTSAEMVAEVTPVKPELKSEVTK